MVITNILILNNYKMKTKIKFAIQYVLVSFLVLLVTGCDLEVKEKFKFDAGIEPQVTFGSKTPWQFIQEQNSFPLPPVQPAPPAEQLPIPAKINEYLFMKQAIEVTGMQGEYSNLTDKRTFFFLKDVAFIQILTTEFSNAKFIIDPVTATVNPLININKLRNILRYHILTTYVDQGPDNLFIVDKDYVFTSLWKATPMSLRRNINFTIVLNQLVSLNTVALRRGGNCTLHNYIFSNGNSVAHVLTTFYARNGVYDIAP